MIHLYTGDGKGKTTAAVGLGIRAAGRDRQVCFAQFMKGNDSGELHILEKLERILGFPHLYYPSNPAFARLFVEKAVRYRVPKG